MLNYAFVNLNDTVSYINDANFAFRGTWSSGSTYSPPLDVVDYNNGKFIVLVQNTNVPPLNSLLWSELVLRGTVSPTDPFAIARTALDTANGASVLALAASGTAQTAMNLVAAGTTAGTNISVTSGTDTIFISGLNLGYAPSTVVCTMQMPSINGASLFASLVGPPTEDGFVVKLSGTTDAIGYRLNWLARR